MNYPARKSHSKYLLCFLAALTLLPFGVAIGQVSPNSDRAPSLPSPLSINPSSENFGSQIVGTSSVPQPMTITNISRLGVIIRQILLTGPYSQTNNCPVLLQAGRSCTANVTFTPTSNGTAVGALTVYPLIRQPASASLSGTGETLTALAISPSQAAIKFGQQLQLSATGYFVDGSQQDLTHQVTWQSSDPTIISVSNDPANAGLASTLSSGIVNITAELTGCTSCPGGGATLGSLPFTSRFEYVANQADGTLSAYTIDAVTGRMRNNGYYPVMPQPVSVAVDPYNRFLYVIGLGSHAIYGYTINPKSGVLTPIGSVDLPDAGPLQLAMDPILGQFLYAIEDGRGVYPYTIDPNSGALTPLGTVVPAGSGPENIALSANGSFAYVLNADQTVSSFTIDRNTGNLIASGNPVTTGSSPNWIAVDPSTGCVYVTNLLSADVSAYSANPKTGALTPLAGSPFAVGSQPNFILPFGGLAFITSASDNRVLTFHLDSSGAFNGLGLAFSSQGSSPIAEATDGSYLYVANQLSDEIATFGIDFNGGNLSYWRSTRTWGVPSSIGLTYGTKPVVYTPKFAFFDNSIAVGAFAIDPKTGSVNSGTYTQKSMGFSTDGFGISIDGRFLIEPENDSSGNRYEVSYGIDSGTGALSLINDVSIPSFAYVDDTYQVIPAAVEPSGRWVYESGVPGSCTPFFCQMGIDQLTLSSTGAVGVVGIEPFKDDSGSARFTDGAGRFVVAYDDSGGELLLHSIDPGSGNLTLLSRACCLGGGGVPAVSGRVAIDPRGRFVYPLSCDYELGECNLYTISIDPLTGSLTVLSSFQIGNVTTDCNLTIDPTGRFLYLTWHDLISEVYKLSQYAINEVDGSLTSITSDIVLSGAKIADLKVDISGQYLYLADATSNFGYAYAIDQTTGALTALNGSPFDVGFMAGGGLALSGSVN